MGRHGLPLIPGTTVDAQKWMWSEFIHTPSDVYQDRKRPERTAKAKVSPSALACCAFSQNQGMGWRGWMVGAEWMD